MNNVVSALTARTQLGQIIRRISRNNERFVVEHRGEPSVIIMSVKDYINTIAPTPDWLQEIGSEAKRKGLNTLTMRQIDAEIRAARRERRQRIAATKPAR
jgi:PHD/YefM family antitoxin component YafN of YafNO toxin-antitoxin module